MQQIDYVVFLIYLVGVLVAGVVLSARNKTTAEMFSAGAQSPWWVAGLSGFMTMFSAGTFVVWGGIAYKHGLVAVAINTCYGVAALLVGWTVAGRWRESGISTPAEYVELRFGKAALHFYTWAILAFKIIGSAVGLYSLCVLLVAMMPLGEGNPLRDATTGNLSLSVAITVLGGMIVFYTMIGGLWGVLMTDVVQFVVLNLAVLILAPLAMLNVGGIEGFLRDAPPEFWRITSEEYTWFFLVGWTIIHYFIVGAEWAYVQRYICVPTASDARKGAWLFGVLYLISPWVWLLPPMTQRISVPIPTDASPAIVNGLAESAYISVCQAVLPAGLVGLMLAAMFSATASAVSAQLNVFAGVLTHDILKPLLKGAADERRLVWSGRVITVLLGAIVISVALLVPRMGGAEGAIISATSLMVGPLLAPLLIGLISKRLPGFSVWLIAAVSGACIFLVRFALPNYGLESPMWAPLLEAVRMNGHTTDIILGAVLPLTATILCLSVARKVAPGWNRVELLRSAPAPAAEVIASKMPTIIMGWSLAFCGLLLAGLALWSTEDTWLYALFALMLFALAGGALFIAGRLPCTDEKGLVNADIG